MRIKKICGEIEPCLTLCDVGCDHGYIAKYALDNNFCQRAIITDISKKSLEKAIFLLRDYIDSGRVLHYRTDGFSGIKEHIDTAVIAGMGGMEIIEILKNANTLPEKLVLQPMKNAESLRQYICADYRIIKDFIFYEGRHYYNLLSLRRGGENLSALQIKYGKTNLQEASDDFARFLKSQITKTKSYLKRSDSDILKERLIELESIYGGEK